MIAAIVIGVVVGIACIAVGGKGGYELYKRLDKESKPVSHPKLSLLIIFCRVSPPILCTKRRETSKILCIPMTLCENAQNFINLVLY